MSERLRLVPCDPNRATGHLSNRFLCALPAPSFDALATELEIVELRAKVVLWQPGTPIRSVYFPHSCVFSNIVPLQDDVAVEASTVGREGFVGVSVLLGGDSTSTQAIVQISGMASRLPSSVFRSAIAEDSTLRELSLQYAQALLEQTAQSVACIGRHGLSERCARWLLMTRDRVDGDEFRLTQEFLAIMLGVRRTSVTIAAGILQRAGFIRYQRGVVTILDRSGLEEASCECYEVVRQKYDKLLGVMSG